MRVDPKGRCFDCIIEMGGIFGSANDAFGRATERATEEGQPVRFVFQNRVFDVYPGEDITELLWELRPWIDRNME
jgi:hypothetical protein